uniref:Uncharacterized protein n=1 Tax=Heterorhabditis bacteriophora TaxID=37862 RepID=A0A1I7XCP5_HETBA
MVSKRSNRQRDADVYRWSFATYDRHDSDELATSQTVNSHANTKTPLIMCARCFAVFEAIACAALARERHKQRRDNGWNEATTSCDSLPLI